MEDNKKAPEGERIYRKTMRINGIVNLINLGIALFTFIISSEDNCRLTGTFIVINFCILVLAKVYTVERFTELYEQGRQLG